MNIPLAIKMRPNKLNEVLGQEHLVGKDKIISNLIKNKKLFSMIFYGKPGIGKTSIAYAIVNELDVRYRDLNAVINNKKDFDIVIEEAKMYKGLVLIMDEIHRMNKDKQDLLLPYIESGLITLIGLTTANPYHKINPAIRSRCQIFELKELEEKDVLKGLKLVIKKNVLEDISIDDEALKHIASISGGDLRYAYNLIEVSYYSTNDKKVDIDIIKKINNKPSFFHDKDGDGYYDVLSAFQKSIRGSDVDAALHYLGRLLLVDDMDSVIRRLSVITFEDVGLANPSVAPQVMSAIEAAERLGMPEARIPLSFAVILLSLSPKSNTAEASIDKVLNDLENGLSGDIPRNITNKPNSGYLYPHNYPNNYVVQQYMPDILKVKKYFVCKGNNKYEKQLLEIYENINNKKRATK